MMSERRIFRTLVSLEEANEKLLRFYEPSPVGKEKVPLQKALGRVLSDDIISDIDVPSFDRATMDGYAVIAEETFGADEDHPKTFQVIGRGEAGERPGLEVTFGKAVEIATGAPMPKGANSVVMVEYTDEKNGCIQVRKAVTPGENVMGAGSDIMAGETVLRKGEMITSREMGVVAALGLDTISVYRKPKVAIVSTGNEIVTVGEKLEYGKIFDINANSLIGAVIESGCEPIYVGIVRDNSNEMTEKIGKTLEVADVVITSGSTSAGVGDRLHTILNSFGQPGVVVHGLSVKPGKPAVVAVAKKKPVFALPGYPTSAMVVFQVLVKPLLLKMSGLNETQTENMLQAKLAVKIFSSGGRREFMPVHVILDELDEYVAYPITGGSGAITSYAMADGFIDIPSDRKLLDEGERVAVTLFNQQLKPPNLTIIGSHCVGIDVLLGRIRATHPEFSAKIVNIGSMGGLNAVTGGEADIAGIHIIDETSGEFNIPYVKRSTASKKLLLFRGYNRELGLVVQKGNPKSIAGFEDLVRKDVSFMNRNAGSGTRILTDLKLREIARRKSLTFDEVKLSINGYTLEGKSHSAVATAIIQGRADVGIAIKAVTKDRPLEFIPVINEHFDFVTLEPRLQKQSVGIFLATLRSKEFREELERKAIGMKAVPETGTLIA
jgi:putative molybdopterin biosynthesis protein